MNFLVNGISYFLTFDNGAEQWCLLRPGRDGIESLEIHNDGALMTESVPYTPVKGGARRVH